MTAPSAFQASPHDGRTNPETVTVFDVLTDWADDTTPTRPTVHIARTVGPCAGCTHKITPGDPIAHGIDGQLEHAACPDDLTIGPHGVCDRCYLEVPLSGVCGTC